MDLHYLLDLNKWFSSTELRCCSSRTQTAKPFQHSICPSLSPAELKGTSGPCTSLCYTYTECLVLFQCKASGHRTAKSHSGWKTKTLERTRASSFESHSVRAAITQPPQGLSLSRCFERIRLHSGWPIYWMSPWIEWLKIYLFGKDFGFCEVSSSPCNFGKLPNKYRCISGSIGH